MLTNRLRQRYHRYCSAQCDLCGLTISPSDGTRLWCRHCLRYFQPIPRCRCCGLPLPSFQDHCGHCLSEPPPWQHLYCLGDYQQPLSGYIHQMKRAESLAVTQALAELLAVQIPRPAPLLLPVPLHWYRRLRRGHNQSSLLAHALSRGWGSQVRVDEHTVKRRQATLPQQGLSRNQRLRNLRHAFSVTRPITATHVAVIDDVVTTGTTVREICQLLLEFGVESIDIYCLCRTPVPK